MLTVICTGYIAPRTGVFHIRMLGGCRVTCYDITIRHISIVVPISGVLVLILIRMRGGCSVTCYDITTRHISISLNELLAHLYLPFSACWMATSDRRVRPP